MKHTCLILALMLATIWCAYSQPSPPAPAVFPAFDVRMEIFNAMNADSSVSTPETIVVVALADTANVKRVRLQWSNPILQPLNVSLSETQLWEKFSGNGTRQGYEIYLKVAGNHTQQPLMVELENRQGSRSVVVNVN